MCTMLGNKFTSFQFNESSLFLSYAVLCACAGADAHVFFPFYLCRFISCRVKRIQSCLNMIFNHLTAKIGDALSVCLESQHLLSSTKAKIVHIYLCVKRRITHLIAANCVIKLRGTMWAHTQFIYMLSSLHNQRP